MLKFVTGSEDGVDKSIFSITDIFGISDASPQKRDQLFIKKEHKEGHAQVPW
jgi:hypothetical protein